MDKLTSKAWWNAAGTRCIKTMAQTFIAVVGSSTIIAQVDWRVLLSSVVMAGILSLVTSLAGLPEVDE